MGEKIQTGEMQTEQKQAEQKQTEKIQSENKQTEKNQAAREPRASSGPAISHNILGVIASLALILALLLSGFQIAAYSDFDYYEKEYTKYEVAADLGMGMPDIMEVTHYMMSYLIGQEDELSIETTIEGRRQDFFNEQDRFHMGEVRDLFLGGLALRRGALVIFALAVLALVLLKADVGRVLSAMYQRTLVVFLALCALLGVLMWQNFNRCFVIFHEIFFDNDLWMFDPATDYMIRMLPEGFFYDMAMRIGGWFIGLLLAVLALSLVWQRVRAASTRKDSSRPGL